MKPSTCLISLALLGFASSASAADAPQTHPKVVEALEWSLPANSCKQPRSVGTVTKVNNEGADSGARADIDSHTLARYERKKKRWLKCVDKYKDGLRGDFETLRGSAQHGLTQDQANAIMSKMKLIQAVMMTEEGLPPVAANEISAVQ
ncbi:MAG: hypothetical protein AB8B93_18235 [Pseudomonadales bacterium]